MAYQERAWRSRRVAVLLCLVNHARESPLHAEALLKGKWERGRLALLWLRQWRFRFWKEGKRWDLADGLFMRMRFGCTQGVWRGFVTSYSVITSLLEGDFLPACSFHLHVLRYFTINLLTNSRTLNFISPCYLSLELVNANRNSFSFGCMRVYVGWKMRIASTWQTLSNLTFYSAIITDIKHPRPLYIQYTPPSLQKVKVTKGVPWF